MPTLVGGAMERCAIGIDLGGTVLKGGIVSESGRLIEYRSTPSRVFEGPDRVLGNLTTMADLLTAKARECGYPVAGIAVATPGVIDPVFGGIVGGAENLPGWEGVPFMKTMHERFGFPVMAHNDVTTHVLGEARFGAGVGKKDVIMASFGTGVGGGIIVGGNLYNGSIGYAGEIGHFTTHAGGQLCACGIRGCWEEYASIRGILRIARRRVDEARRAPGPPGLPGSSLLEAWPAPMREDVSGAGSPAGPDPALIFEAARDGDGLALEIVDEIGREAAIGIGGLINIFNPELFIIGGGIASAGEIYLDAVRRHVPDWTLKLSMGSVRIVPASLGYDAGVIGAAVLAFDRINVYGAG
jgi:glucokinase